MLNSVRVVYQSLWNEYIFLFSIFPWAGKGCQKSSPLMVTYPALFMNTSAAIADPLRLRVKRPSTGSGRPEPVEGRRSCSNSGIC
jgi:hypothetical protein